MSFSDLDKKLKSKPEPKLKRGELEVADYSDIEPSESIVIMPRKGGKNTMYDLSKERLNKSELDIDFSRIANLSSFQRFIIEVIKQQFPETFKKVNPRADKKVMAKEFNKRKAFMKDCMTEFQGLIEKNK